MAVFSAAPFVHDFLESASPARVPAYPRTRAHTPLARFAAPLSAAFDTRFFEPRLNKDTALLAQGCNTVCLFVNDDCDAEVCQLLAAAGVKLIAMRCAGFDRVDVAAATALGMSVVRVPSYSPHAIAEHAVALLMCLNRSLHKAYARVREGNFTLNGLQGFDVHGKTVGIIGTGKIGTITGGILGRGFGARLLGYDAYPSAEFSALGGEYVSLDELLAQSDIISLHAPLNKSTFHLLAAPQVTKMKRGVFIINTSRGGLLDTRAMIDGLESGVIGALGIDVYEDEGPLFFKDFSLLSRGKRMQGWDEIMGTLLSLPNVLVSPHIAFLTTEALDNIACTTIDNIKAYARGEELKNLVKP